MTKERAEFIINNEDAFAWWELDEARRVNPVAAEEADAAVQSAIALYSVAAKKA